MSTRDDIIRMGVQARLIAGTTTKTPLAEHPVTSVQLVHEELVLDALERFAALVAAAEREARQAAQVQNEELKARIARVGLEGNLAKAKAVKAEREACAQVCDSVYHQHIGPQYGEVRHGIAACAAAIRARGEPTTPGQQK